ncbi:MAG: SMP-30/gluconolactonase/LRE family protein, partial [Actinomycetota bacterium]|nr:SMP-30/gluconolactonase/LRE family protein [Actinomycetota bacterium]
MRVLATGLRFPEGPIALPDGSILLVEIERRTLTRVDPDGTVSVVAECGGGPNGAALGSDGAVYICNNGGFAWRHVNGMLLPGVQPDDYVGGSIQRVDLASGIATTLYTEADGWPLKGPNDIVFDRNGGFYFTDLGKGREGDFDRGAIYYAKTDGSSIVTVARPLLTPNGVGLSPDEDRLYFAETMTGRVRYWDLDSPGVIADQGTALASSAATPSKLLGILPNDGRCDSLAVDSEGNVCVATLGMGAITAFAPDGSIRALLPVPGDPMVTNICFGGPELRTAFITASGFGTLVSHEWHCP